MSSRDPLPSDAASVRDAVVETSGRSPDVRFPRSARLRKPAEFKHCFAHGLRANGRYFRLVKSFRDDARMGSAISRKVDKRAVERNRIRRIVREWFRHVRGTLPPADYFINAKPDARNVAAADLRRDLDALFRRALALKPAPPAGTMADGVAPLSPPAS